MKIPKLIAMMIMLLTGVLPAFASQIDSIPGAAAQEAEFYTGKPYDSDLGTYVFACRNYDPELGRWTTADPSGFPDGANSYSYAAAPTSEFDPLGLWKIYSRPDLPNNGKWEFASVADAPPRKDGRTRFSTLYQYRAVYTGWAEYGGQSVGPNVGLDVTVTAAWAEAATVVIGGGKFPIGVTLAGTGTKTFSQHVTKDPDPNHGWMATAAFAKVTYERRGITIRLSSIGWVVADDAEYVNLDAYGSGLSEYGGVLVYE